ncbi:hypothetical protein ACIP5Y_17665 [Nocardia sp. NPDC088792]|uniref:hypothetical protein n=1 Tax=Nocardia sp. NPDC088792 TaxID=3364332 RepID=UPI00381CA839
MREDSKPACSGFDVSKPSRALGSADRFYTELQSAGKRAEPVRLGDITRAAGWSDNWAGMVEVPPYITGAELNSAAETSEHCWLGLPRGDGSDRTVYGYYLFTEQVGNPPVNKPVKPLMWPNAVRELSFGNRRSLSADTVLVPTAKGRFVPVP